jgi:AraC family transcriptional activator of pyochelin receptor
LQTKAYRNGSMQSFQIASELNLHIADFVSSEAIEQRFETSTPVLRFYFHLFGSGYWELRSPYHTRSQGRVNQADRISSLLFYPQMEGRMHLPMECRQFHLSLSITPSRLNTYMGGRPEAFPEALRAISEGRLDRDYAHTGPISRMMHQAVRNLLDCPYTGPMKTLYLETKAAELIVHKLAQTVCEDNGGDRPLKLDRHETDRLWHAREILCRDLENPPGLFDLAHAVGTNHCRLNTGFRELYGTTVFNYLRQKRLIEARRLIEEEDMNVTQAALRVGYNSISSFSKAFSEHFGLPPVKLRKRRG